MDTLRIFAKLHILSGASTVGLVLPPEEIERIISRFPVEVRKPSNWFYVAGRNSAITVLRRNQAAARRLVKDQEDALRHEKEMQSAEEQAYRTNKLLSCLEDAFFLISPKSSGVHSGLRLLIADIRSRKDEYNKLCRGVSKDAIYQRRCRAVKFLKTVLLEKEHNLLLDLVSYQQHI